MAGTNRSTKFGGFGRSRLIALRPRRRLGVRLAGQRLALRRLLRKQCPPLPGVYGMLDSWGQLIYVGKSKCLRDRLLSYLAPPDIENKSHRILQHTDRLIWEPAPHEFTALVRELELIRRWQPPLNVQGQPSRLRKGYVCLGRPAAPYLYLSAQPGIRGQALFGPVSTSQRTREALRRLNDLFQLRDCPERVPMVFADQLELFSLDRDPQCLRHELGTCLGPCAARCTASDYAAAVAAAKAFLEGRDSSPIDRLQAEMEEAARQMAFERAAALRDQLDDLVWLEDQLANVRDVRQNYSFVYPLVSRSGRAVWHWIVKGQIVAITPGPRSPRAMELCRQWMERLSSDRNEDCIPEDIGMLLLVASWFRKYPAELERTYPLAEVPRLLTS